MKRQYTKNYSYSTVQDNLLCQEKKKKKKKRKASGYSIRGY